MHTCARTEQTAAAHAVQLYADERAPEAERSIINCASRAPPIRIPQTRGGAGGGDIPEATPPRTHTGGSHDARRDTARQTGLRSCALPVHATALAPPSSRAVRPGANSGCDLMRSYQVVPSPGHSAQSFSPPMVGLCVCVRGAPSQSLSAGRGSCAPSGWP